MRSTASLVGLILSFLLIISACGGSSGPAGETNVPSATDSGTGSVTQSTDGPSSQSVSELLQDWSPGSSARLFERANEHTDQGMRHLVNATLYIQAGDNEKAEEELRLSEAEFNQAVAMFEEVLARDPEHVSAMVNLGAVYYNLGRLDEAVALYQRALELEPNDAGLHSNLAAAHFQANDIDRALSEYQLAVELDPNLAEAHFGLGVTYMQLQEQQEAIDAFERFQALDDGTDPLASQQAEQYLQELRER